MRKTQRSLLNLCAFSVLALALYLNFVDLNKPEAIKKAPVNALAKVQKHLPAEKH